MICPGQYQQILTPFTVEASAVLPSVRLVLVNATAITEGQVINLRLERTGNPLLTSTVQWSASEPVGVLGNVRDGTLTIPPGQSSTTLSIATVDTTNTTAMTVRVMLSGAIGCSIDPADVDLDVVVQPTTAGGPQPTLSIAASASQVNEGTSLGFVVTRDNTNNNCSATWTASTPNSSSDLPTVRSGTVSFAAGELTKTVSVGTINRTGAQGDRVLTMALSAPVSCALHPTARAATSTIKDVSAPSTHPWKSPSSDLWWMGGFSQLDALRDLREFSNKSYPLDLVQFVNTNGTWDQQISRTVGATGTNTGGWQTSAHHPYLINGAAKGFSWSNQIFPGQTDAAYYATVPATWPATKAGMTRSHNINPITPPGYQASYSATASVDRTEKKQRSVEVWQKASLGWFDALWTEQLMKFKERYFVRYNLRTLRIVVRPTWEGNFDYVGRWGKGNATFNGTFSALTTATEIGYYRTAMNRWRACFLDVFGSVHTSIANDFAYATNQLWCHFCPLANDGAQPGNILDYAPEDFEIWGCDFYDHYPALLTQTDWDNFVNRTGTKGPEGLGAWITACRTAGKYFGLGEWGVWTEHVTSTNARPVYEGHDNPLFVKNVLDLLWAQRATVAYDIYFNKDISTADQTLSTGDKTLAALPGHVIAPWTGMDAQTTVPNPIPMPLNTTNKQAALAYRNWHRNFSGTRP